MLNLVKNHFQPSVEMERNETKLYCYVEGKIERTVRDEQWKKTSWLHN